MNSKTLRCTRTGFTLIELLIVVAIIAILAAIAVPNFLQAQVRSKVSRVYADMRSLATGLEEYATDWNRPPISPGEYRQILNIQGIDHMGALSRLTTPIAYMTNVPHDPFLAKGGTNPNGSMAINRKTFLYRAFQLYLGFSVANANAAALYRGYMWELVSYGPSRNFNDMENPGKRLEGFFVLAGHRSPQVYDATNGTVSHGLIMRTNKGIYTGAEWETAD